MTYEEFYKRVKIIWENPNIDAEETSYWIGELISEQEAAQQNAQADGANESAVEVDPVVQALRNLGDAIAPPSH